MSIMFCSKHDKHWDSDFHDDCPLCIAGEPLHSEAAEAAKQEWIEAMRQEAALIDAKHLNSMSDDYAYTNGSNQWYVDRIREAKRKREAAFAAYLAAQ